MTYQHALKNVLWQRAEFVKALYDADNALVKAIADPNGSSDDLPALHKRQATVRDALTTVEYLQLT